MIYELRHFDTPPLRFTAAEDSALLDLHILWCDESRTQLLPLGLTLTEEGFEGTFEAYNLYDNPFSRVLALIAFTGYGSSVRTSLASCPEFTTNGMLPKCWRRIFQPMGGLWFPACMMTSWGQPGKF